MSKLSAIICWGALSIIGLGGSGVFYTVSQREDFMEDRTRTEPSIIVNRAKGKIIDKEYFVDDICGETLHDYRVLIRLENGEEYAETNAPLYHQASIGDQVCITYRDEFEVVESFWGREKERRPTGHQFRVTSPCKE